MRSGMAAPQLLASTRFRSPAGVKQRRMMMSVPARQSECAASVWEAGCLGTPQNITAQELRIESFFPMDEKTREFFRFRGGGAGNDPAVADPEGLASAVRSQ